MNLPEAVSRGIILIKYPNNQFFPRHPRSKKNTQHTFVNNLFSIYVGYKVCLFSFVKSK